MTAAHPRGRAAIQLREWETLLAGPVEAVLDVLCSPSPESADLRQPHEDVVEWVPPVVDHPALGVPIPAGQTGAICFV